MQGPKGVPVRIELGEEARRAYDMTALDDLGDEVEIDVILSDEEVEEAQKGTV